MSMYAVQFDFPGGRDTLSYREAPEPALADGELLVQFEASTVNPADLKISGGSIAPRAGTSPYTLGWDIVGTVVRLAPGVTSFAPGERVAGLVRMAATGRGTWSQLVALPAASAARAPSSSEPAVLAQLPLVGLTALQAVEELGAQPSGPVLVVGAGGAVGGCTVRLLARLGVEVHALVRTPEQAERVTAELPVSTVYTGEAPPAAFDRVIDAAGVDASDALRPGGLYVTCVPGTLPDGLEARGLTGATALVPASGEKLALLLDYVADGSLRLGQPDVFRLDDIEAALAAFGTHSGRRVALIA